MLTKEQQEKLDEFIRLYKQYIEQQESIKQWKRQQKRQRKRDKKSLIG